MCQSRRIVVLSCFLMVVCAVLSFPPNSSGVCIPEPEKLDNGIDDDCNGWIETAQYSVKSGHPRLLIDSERKPEIIARISDADRTAHQYYTELLGSAVSSYDDAVGTGFYDYPARHLITFAFVYALGPIDGFEYGGRSVDDYGRKGIEWLRAWADAFYTTKPLNNYAAHEALTMSMAYDWLHPLLSDDDKAFILQRFISMAEQMHRFDCKYWFSDYTLGCYTFTAIGMAMLGDNVGLTFSVDWDHYSNPDTFTFDGNSDDKALEYIDLFVSQYIDESFEMWKFASMGGGSFQSMTGHSGDIMMFAEMLDMWHTATGQEHLSQFDMFTSWTEWWTYGTVPYLKNMPDTLSNSGDALLYTDNESMYNLLLPHKSLAAITASKKLTTMPGFESQAGLFNWFMDHHAHQQYSMDNETKIYSIIWHDETVASQSPADLNLPLTRLFGTLDGGDIHETTTHAGGPGIVIMKSDWEDPDATLAVFKPRPYYFLHQDVDSNSFVIYRKGYLAIDSGKYIDGDWNSHERNYTYRSVAHNVFNIYNPDEVVRYHSSVISNDGGQRVPSVSPRLLENYSVGSSADIGGISRMESVDGAYDFIEGDATRAYQSTQYYDEWSAPKISLAKRQFVYLRSAQGANDFFVIHDKVDATDASYQKSWLFHSMHRPDFMTEPSGGQTVNAYGGTPGTYYGGDRFSVYDKGGRLFVATLFPEAQAYKLIGGPDAGGQVNTEDSYEFYVDGQQYASGDCSFCRYRAFVGAWRIEDELTEEATYHNALHVLSPRDIEGLIVDNTDPGFSTSGSWTSRTNGLAYFGNDFAIAAGDSGGTATWTPNLPESGEYHVDIMWNDEHNCTGITYTVTHSGGSDHVVVDQTMMNGVLAGDWYRLGSFNFAQTGGSVSLVASASCPSYQSVVADAVRFVKADQDLFDNQPDVVRVASSNGAMIGALMPDERKAVLFAKADAVIEQAQIAIKAPGTIRILLVDVEPGHVYHITDNGQALDHTASSAQGTLYFETLDAPSHTITVTVGDSNIPSRPVGLKLLQ